MTDPRPITRDQLAKFLPSPAAVRAFERLFNVVGVTIPENLDEIEASVIVVQNDIGAIEADIVVIESAIDEIESLIASQRRPNETQTNNRIGDAEAAVHRRENLQPLIARIEAIEAFVGL